MEHLNFVHNGKERNCRKINISDYAAIRARIRRERVDALYGAGVTPVSIGTAAACPVTIAEESEYFGSVDGAAFLLYRCCHDIDQTFTEEEAGEMVLANDPFVDRLYTESRPASPLTSAT